MIQMPPCHRNTAQCIILNRLIENPNNIEIFRKYLPWKYSILSVVGGISEAQRGAEIPTEGCQNWAGICTISTGDHCYSGYTANINLITWLSSYSSHQNIIISIQAVNHKASSDNEIEERETVIQKLEETEQELKVRLMFYLPSYLLNTVAFVFDLNGL